MVYYHKLPQILFERQCFYETFLDFPKSLLKSLPFFKIQLIILPLNYYTQVVFIMNKVTYIC